MVGFGSLFGGDDRDDGNREESPAGFDDYDEFRPSHLPEPGPYLEGHDVLVDGDHVAFHRTTRDVFEERSVYDMTFGYNLARLNLDTRHPNAGYRYARETDEPSVLRAEFTPTTPFCPQTHTLLIGSFRAWNGLPDRHEFDLVRVRAAPMHHQSEAVNGRLESLEASYRETGAVTPPEGSGSGDDRREYGHGTEGRRPPF